MISFNLCYLSVFKNAQKTGFPVTLSEFVDRYYLSSKIVLSEFDDSRNYAIFANLENV